MSLKKCIKATTNLNDADVESVTDSFDTYSERMDQDVAAKLAIDDTIASLEQERAEYLELFDETYPEARKPVEKPKSRVQSFDSDTETGEAVRTMKGKQSGWGLKEHYKNAHDNQVLLNEVAESITTVTSANYIHAPKEFAQSEAGEKTKKSARRKINEKYRGDGSNMTDIVRGTFTVKSPKDVAVITARLGEQFDGVDEGWAMTSTGYFDRKILIQFDGGQIGEIQLVAPNTLNAKENLGMHDVYDDWRKTLTPSKKTGSLVIKPGMEFLSSLEKNTMSRFYAEAIGAEADTAWRDVYADVARSSLSTQDSSELIEMSLASSITTSTSSEAQAPSRKTAAATSFSGVSKSTVGSYSYESERTILPSGKSIIDSYIKSLPKTAIRGGVRLDLRSGKDDIQTGDFIQHTPPAEQSPKKSLTVESLTGITKSLQRDFHGTRELHFHIFETQAEAFGSNSVKENGVLKGGFYAGTNEVVMIAENIKDVNEAITVMRHEVVGHFGLRKLLNGKGEYDALLVRVYDSRTGELKDLYDWVAKIYPDLIVKNDIRAIADEMLARAAETKTKSNLLTKIYDEIIKLLNKIGLVMDTISHSEVDSLVRSSEMLLRKNIISQSYGNLVWSDKADGVREQAQFDLFTPEGLPAEVARSQVTDNFNIKYKQVEVGKLKVGLTTVTSPEEAAHVLAPIRKHGQETMMAVVLDKNKKILHVIRHTKGVKDGASVSPVELAAAIGATEKAASVWIGHNHPSGQAIPSSADRTITGRVKDALDGSGIELKGHIVLGKGAAAYSMDGNGDLMGEIKAKPLVRKSAAPVTERMIRKNKMEDAPTITNTKTAKEFIRNEATKNGVILMNTQHYVIGVLSMSPHEMKNLRDGKQIPRILKAIDETNTSAVIVVTEDKNAAHNLNTYFMRLGDLNRLDTFVRDGASIISLEERGEASGSYGAVFHRKEDQVDGGRRVFDSNDPNILFNRAADTINDAPTDGNLGMPDETVKDRWLRGLHDAFNRVKKLQETIEERGGKIETETDVYRTEERSSSKISFRLRELEKQRQKPMRELMKKNGIDLDTLDLFVMAKHAQERNEYIASINDEMPDGGSGITNQEARDILEELSDSREVLEEIAEFVYTVNNEALTNLVEGGHLKQETADEWRARWKYYVPLKGKDGIELHAGTGTGFAISGAGIKKAMGRGEGNRAESPVAHSFAQAESIIVRTEKTKVGRALVELVRANPDPGFWTISKRVYKKFETLFGEPFEGYEEAPEGLIEDVDYHRVSAISQEERARAKKEGRKPVGKIVYRLDQNYKRRDDVFTVMVEGEELLINIKDKVLMEQLKKMNTTQLNAVVRGFGRLNRYLAMINTALNPEFVITNFERDFQTAMINLGGEHSAAIAAKVMKGIPGAMRGIWQSTFDTKGTSEWRALFDEMQEAGGTIGFFGLEDIETKVKNIQRKLTDQPGVLGQTKKGLLTVRDIVLDANLSVENASRLAAYKVIKEESLKNGMSMKDAKAKAASVAKNLTVNFNRKGELAPVFNSAYLFFNATVQGSMRIITALKHKRVRKIVTGVAIAAYFQAMYNQGAGGDDEDGVPNWDKISDYLKQTNIIFMHPDGSGNYSKIKLPYGYNVFYYAGTAMYDLQYGKDSSATKTTMNMLSAILNAYNPIQGADLLDSITPTFLKPYEQDVRNTNFMGAKLKPEYPFDTYDRPESQKHFKSTNPQLVEMMKYLNEATGGDETHSGLIDMSPEIVEHYIGWVTGGAGKFATRTIDTASKLVTGDEIDQRDVPFLRTLGGKRGSHYDTNRYYESMKAVAAVEAQLKLYKGTDNWADYRDKNSEVHKLAINVRRYKNAIKNLRTQRDKAYIDDDRDLAAEKTEMIRQRMMEFSMKYDEALEEQK